MANQAKVTNTTGTNNLDVKKISWGDVTWTDISAPNEEAKKYLLENFSFHPMDIEDCFSRRQLAKLDEYESYIFVVFHFPVYDKATRTATTHQWSAFIGENYLVTLHPKTLIGLEEARREFEIKDASKQAFFNHGSGYLLYTLVDRTIDSYFPILDKIITLLESVEDEVFDEVIEASKEISVLRRDIMIQRRVMFPTRTLIAELEKKLKRFAKIDLSVYFGDLIDHMNKICETLDECKETVEVYKDTDYVLSNERLGKIMRVLTVLSTVAIPAAIISSIYGMNIRLPGDLNTNAGWETIIILVIAMIVMSVSMIYFFKRKRWI